MTKGLSVLYEDLDAVVCAAPLIFELAPLL